MTVCHAALLASVHKTRSRSRPYKPSHAILEHINATTSLFWTRGVVKNTTVRMTYVDIESRNSAEAALALTPSDDISNDPKLAAADSPSTRPDGASTLYPDIDFGYYRYDTGADAIQTDLYTNVDYIQSLVRAEGEKGAYYGASITLQTRL